MRIPALLVAGFAICLASCGSDPKPVVKVTAKKTPDESRRFPSTNLIDTKVVDQQLMGKPFMPGGTLARYKLGKTEYEMFVTRMASPAEAANLLPDWRNSLTGAKFVPSFGGYFGLDAGRRGSPRPGRSTELM